MLFQKRNECSLFLQFSQTRFLNENSPYSSFQIFFENEVSGAKWRHFYNEIVNKYDIVIDAEFIFDQLIDHSWKNEAKVWQEIKCYFCTMVDILSNIRSILIK